MNHQKAIFKLEGIEKPGNLINEELEVILRRFLIKLTKLKSCQIHVDKLTLSQIEISLSNRLINLV